MIKPVHPAALLLALSAFWLPAQAQNVYRCGESYSNTPCPGGTVVPTDDPRSAAQRAQTDAATRRDAKSAQVLENERLKQEGKPARPIIMAPAPPSEPALPLADKAVSKAKLKKPELFTAVAPKKPGEAVAKKKKKKKAAKAAAA
jgi:hypothetical protein